MNTLREIDGYLSDLVIENMAEGVVLINWTKRSIIFTNSRFDQMFGYLPGELVGESPDVLFAENNQKTAKEISDDIRKNFRQNESWNGEVLNIRKDGGKFWCSVNTSSFEHSEYGKVIIALHTDVTDKKISAETLEKNQEFLKKAQSIAKLGYISRDLRTGIPTATDEIYRIYGVQPGEEVETFAKYVHPDDKDNLLKKLQNLREHGEPFSYTHRIYSADGILKWIHATGEGVTDDNGDVTEITGIVQDITDLKVAEQELQKIQKIESLGFLAGGIAHDFNNILTMLFGNISLVKDSLPEESEEFKSLQNAEESLSRASRLTNKLLTFSKGGEPVRKAIDLGKLVDEISQFNLTGSKIKPVQDIEEDLWLVDADEAQMEQVFTNLAINAEESMPGGGKLFIKLKNVDKPDEDIPNDTLGHCVKITVRDEGAGIPSDQVNQIFDPYFSTKDRGSGLGLTTVFSIINRHDGHIEVSSEVGKGTTFTIYIPASGSQLKSPVTQEKSQDTPEVKKMEKAVRVLVMDDEELICALVKSMLENSGHEVKTVNNGLDAIAMYKQSMDEGNPFDCIIMDLTIRDGMGGKEAIQELHKINSDIKAIVSTGYADDPVLSNCQKYGFRDILPKPFTQKTLYDVFNRVIG